MSLFIERSASGRILPSFFRSTWAWIGKVIPTEKDSPEQIKILVTVLTFHKPVNEVKLQDYVMEVLEEYDKHFQSEEDEIETGFEAVQVSHEEAAGLGFYRVAVTVDDVEIRREALR